MTLPNRVLTAVFKDFLETLTHLYSKTNNVVRLIIITILTRGYPNMKAVYLNSHTASLFKTSVLVDT